MIANATTDWVTALIAVVALVQTWVIATYRRVLRPGKVEIHQAGFAEVAFGASGVSLSLQGTILGVNRPVFVKTMRLRLTIESGEGEEHVLDWAAMRPTAMVGDSALNFEVPTGFLIHPEESRHYHVLFQDRTAHAAVQGAIVTMIRAWQSTWNKSVVEPVLRLPGLLPPEVVQADVEERRREAETAFMLGEDFHGAENALRASDYLRAGTYRMTLEVDAREGRFPKVLRFALTQEESDGLRRNAAKVLWDAIGIRNALDLLIVRTDYLEPTGDT